MDFAISAAKIAIIAPCMGSEIDSDSIISRMAVVYESGRIARSSDAVRHAVDPDELALCNRLTHEAFEIMEHRDIGMGSESGTRFDEFFVAADVGAPRPGRLDESAIRRAFGGTIFPPATITQSGRPSVTSRPARYGKGPRGPLAGPSALPLPTRRPAEVTSRSSRSAAG
jgi:hypothetical protein